MSIWEVTSSNVATLLSTTNSLLSSRQQRRHVRLDPQWAIAKYYRSAAGVGSRKYPPRSPAQLMMTMDHLISLLYQRLQQYPTSISLYAFVQFWFDRVRAIQVELIVTSTSQQQQQQQGDPTLNNQSLRKRVQHRIIVELLMFGYLLRDHPHSKELQVQHRSLFQTALAEFWTSGSDSTLTNDDTCYYEEIIWIAALTHLSSCLERSTTTSADNIATTTTTASSLGGYAAMLWQYQYSQLQLQRHKQSPSQFLHRPDILMDQILLQLVQYAVREEYGSLLALLLTFHRCDDDGDDNYNAVDPSSSPTKSEVDEQQHTRRRLGLLARLSLAPVLHFLRWHLLRQYNVSWAPREEISAQEVCTT